MKITRLRRHLPTAAAILALPAFALFFLFRNHGPTDNALAIPAKYADAGSFHEGLARVTKKTRSLKPVSKWSLSKGFSSLLETKYRFAYIDKTGKEIIPENQKDDLFDLPENASYWDLYPWPEYFDFHEGLAAVARNGKYGFKDKTGKEVIPPKFDEVGYFQNGFAPVQINGRWGFIDKTGKVVVPIKYERNSKTITGFIYCGMIEKYGYYNEAKEEIIPPECENKARISRSFVQVDEDWKLSIASLPDSRLLKTGRNRYLK
jgi:hypothetical protein